MKDMEPVLPSILGKSGPDEEEAYTGRSHLFSSRTSTCQIFGPLVATEDLERVGISLDREVRRLI